MKAVAENNPEISSKEVMKEEVYSFLFPGLLMFLIPILLSVLLKIGIEYLIDYWFSTKAEGKNKPSAYFK